MKCPICKSNEPHNKLNLHAEGFAEEIVTCKICGAVWSISHGATLIIRDSQEDSFLAAGSECVEADDFGVAAA